MEGERESLQLLVEVGPEVVDHSLADVDRDEIARNRKEPEKDVEHHEADRDHRQEFLRARGGGEASQRQGFSAEHVVDHDLDRPRLQNLGTADPDDQKERDQQAAPVGLHVGQDAPPLPREIVRASLIVHASLLPRARAPGALRRRTGDIPSRGPTSA